jgi:cytidine deaminase
LELERTLSQDDIERLLRAAREAASHAYVPYSEFPVGAAVLTASGDVITGANVENASYPLTMCAERIAIGTAVAAGHREILAVAVTSPRAAGVTPCGGCRQVLNEFKPAGADMLVILDTSSGPEIVPLGNLLPRSFGPADLG